MMVPKKTIRVKPDYQGGSIVNLMSTIAARFGHRTGYRTLEGLTVQRLFPYEKVVLIVLDGLGLKYLEGQGGRGFFISRLAGRMTSVFPSTTASAITTFATGAAPSEHGVAGWFTYLRELGSVSKILFSGPRYGGVGYSGAGIPMELIVKASPLFPDLRAKSFVVTPEHIADGDFAKATTKGAVVMGYQTLVGLCLGITRALESSRGPTFVSAYWPELDSTCHRHGTQSRQAREHFLELERAIESLVRRQSNGETLFLITADHGLIDTPLNRFIDLGRLQALADCLSLPLCGEPRLAYGYVHPDRAVFFRSQVKRHLGHACRIYTRRQLLDQGYFGPGRAQPWFQHRVGDFILEMNRGWSLRDFLPVEERSSLKAGHGGTSPDEMLVPLIVAG